MDSTIKEGLLTVKEKLPDGRKRINDYIVGKKYGKGAHGTVRSCVHEPTGEKFAMKSFNKLLLRKQKEYLRRKKGGGGMRVKTGLDKIWKEIELLKTLAHRNVVSLHEIIDDEENDKLYLVLDDCQFGEIMSWKATELRFKPYNGAEYFTEAEIKSFLSDILDGIEYLHEDGVVHRDIKPANILVTEDRCAKICDFGVASRLEDKENDILENTEGTYHFMPPECWNYEERKFHGKKCDIWAVGVTLFALTFNSMPFWAENEYELSSVIVKQELDFTDEKCDREVSKELKDLILGILEKDPERRLSIKGIRDSAFFN